MERGPKATGAMTALLIALAFGLVLAWTQRTVGPSEAELATALSRATGQQVGPGDVEALRCGESIPVGYQCRWRQRDGDSWQERGGRLAADATGWRLVEETD